jgi:ferredoxin-NADP reductase
MCQGHISLPASLPRTTMHPPDNPHDLRTNPLVWREAAVAAVRPETPRAKTLALDVPGWPGHRAGQHVDVRLTAEDGYQAQRSYSIASAPAADGLELTVERIDDGEVSPYLVDELRPGDAFELRGPIGGWFTWEPADGGPLLLVAGGSGLVPLMAMLRHRADGDSAVDARLLLSAGRYEDVLYREQLMALAQADGVAIHQTLTRAQPPDWTGWDRRVDADMLEAVGPSPEAAPRTYVCGPTPFVERVAGLLVELGHAPRAIRTERFGPTGG